jgi:glutathione S-transferase
MISPDGLEMWGKQVYREIKEPERLVFVNSFSDEKGGITRHPLHISWPLELLTTVTFQEQGGKTTVTVEWLPIKPSEEEWKTFDTNRDSMNQGWGGSFEALAEYLARGNGMSLTLHMHPLSSFCHKVLIALYENDIPFETKLVNLGKPSEREEYLKLSPFGKIPTLRDEKNRRTVNESTIIIEYLDRHYPGKVRFIPNDSERQLEVRLSDRLLDLYLHESMQKVVLDKLRPAGKNDPFGVEQAKQTIQRVYQLLDRELASKTWAVGENFTLADCAAGPPLFFTNKVLPFESYKNLTAYFQRLVERPSYARVLREAEPYFAQFPG